MNFVGFVRECHKEKGDNLWCALIGGMYETSNAIGGMRG